MPNLFKVSTACIHPDCTGTSRIGWALRSGFFGCEGRGRDGDGMAYAQVGELGMITWLGDVVLMAMFMAGGGKLRLRANAWIH